MCLRNLILIPLTRLKKTTTVTNLTTHLGCVVTFVAIAVLQIMKTFFVSLCLQTMKKAF